MKRVSVRASRTILYTYYSRSETKCRQKCGFRQLRGFPFSQQQRPAARMQYKVELSKNTKKCKCTYCLTLKRLKSMFYFRKEKYLNGAKQRQNLHIGSHKKYYIYNIFCNIFPFLTQCIIVVQSVVLNFASFVLSMVQ